MSAMAATAISPHMCMKCKPFYINIILLNKDEVVANKVAEKTGKGFLGKAAAFAANKIVSDEKIVTQLSESLIEGISKTISELGIEADFEIKYQEGPLVVIKIQIVEVNNLQLILSAKGPDFASDFSTLLVTVERLGMKDSVEAKVNDKIHSMVGEGMMNKFATMIPTKMAEKGVSVECVASTPEQEGEVFFDLHSRI